MVKIIYSVLFVAVSIFVGSNGAPNCGEPPDMDVIDDCCSVGKKTALDEIAEKCEAENKKPDEEETAMCTAECVFKKAGIPLDGNIDAAKLKPILQEKLGDEEFANLMTTMFQNCKAKVPAIIQKMGPVNPASQCKPYASVMVICLVTESLTNCPASKWQDTPQCNKIRDHIKSCPIIN